MLDKHITHTRSSFTNLHTCGMLMLPSVTLNRPHWRVNDKIESLVMPGKIRPFNGGVINSCSVDDNISNAKRLNDCRCIHNTQYRHTIPVFCYVCVLMCFVLVCDRTYLHHRWWTMWKCSLCRLRWGRDRDRTAKVPAVILCWPPLFAHEWWVRN